MGNPNLDWILLAVNTIDGAPVTMVVSPLASSRETSTVFYGIESLIC